jgi:hypothetical protein
MALTYAMQYFGNEYNHIFNDCYTWYEKRAKLYGLPPLLERNLTDEYLLELYYGLPQNSLQIHSENCGYKQVPRPTFSSPSPY